VQAASGDVSAGFERALEPREFSFPRDHGAHPEFATEWWYYTGNLEAEGRQFGYQLTFFRSALAPKLPDRESDWATSNIYMAHFALTDVADEQFYAFERFSRAAAGLAGAEGEPQFRVWLEDWSVVGGGAEGLPMRLRASQDGVALDLTLDSKKPIVLQGDRGLSQKGAEPGQASYYLSYTRLETQGEVRIGEQRFPVRGLSWMDHEFGTGMLDKRAVGWDWFGLHLDDGSDLLYARVRAADGQSGAFAKLVAPDGSSQVLDLTGETFEELGSWRSPRTGTEYPSGWRLRIPTANLDLRVTPYLPDQELSLAVIYWEGAAQVEGTADGQPIRGSGYVELTGYAERGEGSIQVR
jgi:predicted secreted hydrolase